MASPTKTIKDFEKIVTALEKRRKSRIFCVVHTGPPQHICGPEYYKLRESRDHFSGVDTLEVLIHSPGGHAHQAYRLARYFRTHCKKLNAIIPIYAKSAATILCLNADAVFMGELAELGPIDAQMREEMEKGQEYFSPLDEFKSLEFLREYASDILDYLSFVLEHRGMSVKQALHESISGTVGIMNPLYSHIDPSRLGSYRRVLAESEDYAKRLLRFKLDEDEAAELARHLVWDYPVHDFVIDRREARNIGLPVQKLPISEERKLIGVLEALEEHEIPYVGFVKHEAQRQPRRVRAKHKAAQKLPTAVKPAARTAVAS